MTTGIAVPSERTAATDIPDAIRIAGMVLILLVVLVGPSPFEDRTGTYLIESGAGGNLANQVLFIVMGGIAGSLLLRLGLSTLYPLVTTPALATFTWFLVTTATSVEPATSVRRFISLIIMMIAAAAFLVLARNLRQFTLVLGGTALAIVVICYTGVMIVPSRAIHTAFDIIEPEHAGNWRGLYNHKNGAGPIMAVFIFVGLFWRQMGHPVLGATLTLLSAIFLAFTMAKAAMVLAPAVLALSWLCDRSSSWWWRASSTIGPILVLSTVTLGTVASPTIHALATSIFDNLTFTGRTEIWQFALDNIAKRPTMGFGYGTFWESVFYGANGDAAGWVNAIKSAHNGFLSVALDIGLPGLGLTMWWYVLAPLCDLQRHTGQGRMEPLALLFLRIWLFVLLVTVFETTLYVPTNGLAFLITMAAFGLRYLASRPVITENSGTI